MSISYLIQTNEACLTWTKLNRYVGIISASQHHYRLGILFLRGFVVTKFVTYPMVVLIRD